MIAATYFDGQSSLRRPVTLMIHKRVVVIDGAGVRRSIRLSRLDISERLEHAPRILRLPDGSVIEVSDLALNRLLRKNGYRDPWVVRWQQNWPWSLFALVSVLAMLIAGYQWGLPWAADNIAQRLPASIETRIGDEQLEFLDGGYMTPSKLDPAEQARLKQLFSDLRQPRGEKTVYRLEFRESRIGPNAFALSNGVIVMTDQMVTLAQSDQAVLAVLAHELGHVQRHHSLRHLLQAAGVGVMVNLMIGDISTVLAAAPAFLLDQKYSRDFEREADQYAIDMMKANDIPLSPLVEMFEKMGSARGGDKSSQRDGYSDYFSSHPSDDERVAKLKAADRR